MPTPTSTIPCLPAPATPRLRASTRPRPAPPLRPRPERLLGSALKRPPTATRGDCPSRPLHQPPPTFLPRSPSPESEKGSAAPSRRMPSPVESCPSCCRCLVSLSGVAVCCRPPLPAPPHQPLPPPSLSSSLSLPPNPHPRSCSSPPPPSSLSLSPPSQWFRCSRSTRTPSSLETPPPPLATRHRPRHMLSPSPPLSSPRTQLFSVAVRRDVDPSSCRATTDPRPRHSFASHPSSLFGPRQTTPVAPPLARRSPPPLRSPDVVHRSRRLAPRSSLSSQLSPSPVAAAELVHATPRR
jgi:hypothetical protein